MALIVQITYFFGGQWRLTDSYSSWRRLVVDSLRSQNSCHPAGHLTLTPMLHWNSGWYSTDSRLCPSSTTFWPADCRAAQSVLSAVLSALLG